jgi:hypothetical protein
MLAAKNEEWEELIEFICLMHCCSFQPDMQSIHPPMLRHSLASCKIRQHNHCRESIRRFLDGCGRAEFTILDSEETEYKKKEMHQKRSNLDFDGDLEAN